MISSSLTSGMLPRSLRSALPNSLKVSTSGTSSGGSFQAALPGDDFSKMRFSFWLMWRVALRVMCFIAPPPRLPEQRVRRLHCPPAIPQRYRSHFLWSSRCSTRARHCRVRDKTFQGETADDLVSEQAAIDDVR